jgi:hypothetical protein
VRKKEQKESQKKMLSFYDLENEDEWMDQNFFSIFLFSVQLV